MDVSAASSLPSVSRARVSLGSFSQDAHDMYGERVVLYAMSLPSLEGGGRGMPRTRDAPDRVGADVRRPDLTVHSRPKGKLIRT